MPRSFARLEERVSELGNHHRKYLRGISKHRDLLIERLADQRRIEEVHLWSPSPNPAAEMEAVADMGRDLREKLDFLGCFFAFKMLDLNIRAVDVLRLADTSRDDISVVYRQFMLRIGEDLQHLTGSYMAKLLELFLPGPQQPEFVICAVGTRADQDDIDLAVVDDGSERRRALNRAIGNMGREMLRRAIPLHLYISEQVGEQRLQSASIDEYVALLDMEISDFVMITELLGARPIIGSRRMYELFRNQVTDRYFFRPKLDNRYHEGYLRGMVGEIRALLLRRLPRDRVHPKVDALRILKGLLAAYKTIHGIGETNAWHILDRLKELRPEQLATLTRLEEALSFIEVFRFLYQLLEVQEEQIELKEEGSRSRLESVAELMGFQDVGVVRAHDYLLVQYHEHVKSVRDAAARAILEMRGHLERNSVFSRVIRNRVALREADRKGHNLAVQFVGELRFFRGTRYWDDVMDPMEDDLDLLRHFVADFNSLPGAERTIWIQRYAKWGEITVLPVLRLLVLLYKQRRSAEVGSLHLDLSDAFITRMSRRSDAPTRFATVFSHFPKLVSEFLQSIGRDRTERFSAILDEEAYSEEVEVYRRKLVHFCCLHCCSSRYLQRFMIRVVSGFPEYAEHFDEPERLGLIAKGILARSENLDDFDARKQGLGEYYDLQFLRVGLDCIGGVHGDKVNADFTEFTDNYMQALFDVCKQEAKSQTGGGVHTHDLLAVYSAGGHGRKLAFDDDYDLIVLLRSENPEIHAFCARIMARMNREIVRRGTMPHFRFADHFGSYVTTFAQLRELLGTPTPSTFIDISQLLGARLVVGSSRFPRALWSEIIEPLIVSRKDELVGWLADEIRSRQQAVDDGIIAELDVKETRGGLRDIELLLLILAVRCDLWQQVLLDLGEPLTRRMPRHERRIARLIEAFRWLKRVRDLYRLTATAEDELIPRELGHVARILGYCDDHRGEAGRDRLLDDFRTTTRDVARIVDHLLAEVVP